jgi:hypothetical protein
VLTATAKECTFDIAGMSTFIELLRGADIAQLTEIAGEWASEGIKAVVGEDGKGVWWVVASLVGGEIIPIEDVIVQVAKMVSQTEPGKVFLVFEFG